MLRVVAELPDRTNFYMVLNTRASLRAVADLYRAAGWQVSISSWTDITVSSDIAELVIEGEPILVHGLLADPVANVDAVTRPLRLGSVAFSCECYDDERRLLFEQSWPPAERGPTS
jgi:hypothetical protein